ncbi:uncharacterized protein LOC126766186 [Bactrocera neohumeralis]|uniref:uncharacterized protein LOC120779785 n=1 Tax=Bactrocera tryoni TaxID=59916 RepID=UPI001A969204|nr:uncharacterized protein LOC120779785 [Bactrocera tryoni]XP_050340036.1 uncharacterized protein LOC126766186 [Bactrocera neohumeralis]
MDVEETQTTSNTVRSDITAPKASAAPAAAPRANVMRPPLSAAAVREIGEEQLVEPQGPPCCSLCHRPLALKQCTIFQSMKLAQRQQVARAHGHCMTCMADDHATIECWANGAYQYCHRPHHTLFHRFPTRANHTNSCTRPRSDPIRRRRRTQPTTRRTRPSPPRHAHRQQQRRSTGLSAVLSTLQQLQRLLAD